MKHLESFMEDVAQIQLDKGWTLPEIVAMFETAEFYGKMGTAAWLLTRVTKIKDEQMIRVVQQVEK